MGEAKNRQAQGLQPRTVKLPAITHEEFKALHDLMHRAIDEMRAAGDEARAGELRALESLHHKVFRH
ncbi:MAG TPA: hypothetical protein VFQ45_05480 [Longimicrobium sp.]|nr:hypothetical protein [Longimicrobium sp.]